MPISNLYFKAYSFLFDAKKAHTVLSISAQIL